GDQEDRIGRPFVGPAGRLFDQALEEAGIDRASTYTTNAVKHFKWQARGKRRIHQKPNWAEMTACRPWLEAELKVVEPRVLVRLVPGRLRQRGGEPFAHRVRHACDEPEPKQKPLHLHPPFVVCSAPTLRRPGGDGKLSRPSRSRGCGPRGPRRTRLSPARPSLRRARQPRSAHR